MSNPTISIPRSQKRWPISTIFNPEKMHTIFMPLSSWPSYCIRHPYHTTFVPSIVPPSSIIIIPLSSTTIIPLSSTISHTTPLKISNLPLFPPFPPFPRFSPFPPFPPTPAIPQPRSARDRTEPYHAHDDFAARVTKWRAVQSGKRPRRGLLFTNRSPPGELQGGRLNVDSLAY